MTAKQNILAIYPDAYVTWQHRIYTGRLFGQICDTEKEGWKLAWLDIQEQMLQGKLES